MKLNRRKILLTLLILAVVAQLVPIDRTNPPVTAELAAPPEVMSLFRRSCYDCHSNETVWPWYSRVAPLSWLVAFDVIEGRGHLNFSIWGGYPEARQAKLLREISETVSEGEMPPFYYLPAHPQARLNERDRTLVHTWTGSGPRYN